jgi:hypothetical protein
MDYTEFKVNILDLLARYSQIHEDNPIRVEAVNTHCFALYEAEIRQEPDDDSSNVAPSSVL